MSQTAPRCIVLGGINGAGKTTSSRTILAETLKVMTFVNADVALRVSAGGHNIPADTIRRRYKQSIRNFFDLYRPTASEWHVYDNSVSALTPRVVACGDAAGMVNIVDPAAWAKLEQEREQ